MLQALQVRQRSASNSTLVLGAGACTEVPIVELIRDSDEVVLADLDLASMRQGRDELVSPALRKKVRLLSCDVSGGVSVDLNRLIKQQSWDKLVPQGVKVVFDAAAHCLEQCPVLDPPEIESLHAGEFGVVISSLVLSQLFNVWCEIQNSDYQSSKSAQAKGALPTCRLNQIQKLCKLTLAAKRA
jgi:hypothetical protein